MPAAPPSVPFAPLIQRAAVTIRPSAFIRRSSRRASSPRRALRPASRPPTRAGACEVRPASGPARPSSAIPIGSALPIASFSFGVPPGASSMTRMSMSLSSVISPRGARPEQQHALRPGHLQHRVDDVPQILGVRRAALQAAPAGHAVQLRRLTFGVHERCFDLALQHRPGSTVERLASGVKPLDQTVLMRRGAATSELTLDQDRATWKRPPRAARARLPAASAEAFGSAHAECPGSRRRQPRIGLGSLRRSGG